MIKYIMDNEIMARCEVSSVKKYFLIGSTFCIGALNIYTMMSPLADLGVKSIITWLGVVA